MFTNIPCVQFSSYIFSLKTSFMKWKPDYDSAASEYAKAGENLFVFFHTQHLTVTHTHLNTLD